MAALFYSLLMTCRIRGLDPAAYLREAVHRLIASDRKIFLPSDYQDLIEAGEIHSREHALS